MAPGCSNIQLKTIKTDTIDSFEVLEQTVMKQKRLTKKKKTDLRMRILLKRTFDLVCEIMDRENGFDGIDEDDDNVVVKNKINTDDDDDELSSIPLPNENQTNIVQVDHKEYHMLTNVIVLNESSVCDDSNNKNKLKRKLDTNVVHLNNFTNNNTNNTAKKLKLVDIDANVNTNEF